MTNVAGRGHENDRRISHRFLTRHSQFVIPQRSCPCPPDKAAPIFEIFNDPPSSEMRYSNGIYENPPVFKDGYLLMPEGPGLGVTVRKDLIAS